MCGVNSRNFFSDVAHIIREECKERQVIYVSLLRPYERVMEGFQETGVKIENIFIVDCSSKDSYPIYNHENAIHLRGQEDLTSIGIAIDRATKHIEGEKTVIIGSLGMLFLYNDAKVVLRFMKFLTKKMKSMNIDTILIVTKDDPTGMDEINTVKTFCDVVKNIEEVKK